MARLSTETGRKLHIARKRGTTQTCTNRYFFAKSGPQKNVRRLRRAMLRTFLVASPAPGSVRKRFSSSRRMDWCFSPHSNISVESRHQIQSRSRKCKENAFGPKARKNRKGTGPTSPPEPKLTPGPRACVWASRAPAGGAQSEGHKKSQANSISAPRNTALGRVWRA